MTGAVTKRVTAAAAASNTKRVASSGAVIAGTTYNFGSWGGSWGGAWGGSWGRTTIVSVSTPASPAANNTQRITAAATASNTKRVTEAPQAA